MTKLHYWLQNTKGSTAIEYGMIMVGIAIALMTVIFTMGDSLGAVFEKMATLITAALS